MSFDTGDYEMRGNWARPMLQRRPILYVNPVRMCDEWLAELKLERATKLLRAVGFWNSEPEAKRKAGRK